MSWHRQRCLGRESEKMAMAKVDLGAVKSIDLVLSGTGRSLMNRQQINAKSRPAWGLSDVPQAAVGQGLAAPNSQRRGRQTGTALISPRAFGHRPLARYRCCRRRLGRAVRHHRCGTVVGQSRHGHAALTAVNAAPAADNRA